MAGGALVLALMAGAFGLGLYVVFMLAAGEHPFREDRPWPAS